jgi:hypothetical protein
MATGYRLDEFLLNGIEAWIIKHVPFLVPFWHQTCCMMLLSRCNWLFPNQIYLIVLNYFLLDFVYLPTVFSSPLSVLIVCRPYYKIFCFFHQIAGKFYVYYRLYFQDFCTIIFGIKGLILSIFISPLARQIYHFGRWYGQSDTTCVLDPSFTVTNMLAWRVLFSMM